MQTRFRRVLRACLSIFGNLRRKHSLAPACEAWQLDSISVEVMVLHRLVIAEKSEAQLKLILLAKMLAQKNIEQRCL